MKKSEYCQSENAPKVSQKFACQPFFLQKARAETRTGPAGQKYTFTQKTNRKLKLKRTNEKKRAKVKGRYAIFIAYPLWKRSKMETCRPIAELPSCQNWSKIKVSRPHKSKENGPKIDVWRKMSRDCLAGRKNAIGSPPWGFPLGGQVGPKLGPMAAKMGFQAPNNGSSLESKNRCWFGFPLKSIFSIFWWFEILKMKVFGDPKS